MARKTEDISWIHFSQKQQDSLENVDFYGNNGWARNSQLDLLMPDLLKSCAEAGLTLETVKEAMCDIGYSTEALHQLDRWESKRTKGVFGP